MHHTRWTEQVFLNNLPHDDTLIRIQWDTESKTGSNMF